MASPDPQTLSVNSQNFGSVLLKVSRKIAVSGKTEFITNIR